MPNSSAETAALSVLTRVFAILEGVEFDFGVQRELHNLKAELEADALTPRTPDDEERCVNCDHAKALHDMSYRAGLCSGNNATCPCDTFKGLAPRTEPPMSDQIQQLQRATRALALELPPPVFASYSELVKVTIDALEADRQRLTEAPARLLHDIAEHADCDTTVTELAEKLEAAESKLAARTAERDAQRQMLGAELQKANYTIMDLISAGDALQAKVDALTAEGVRLRDQLEAKNKKDLGS